MKQNKLFLGLATIAAVLTFASCSSDEPELNSQQPKQANTISFTSTLSNSKSGSRATTDPQSTAVSTSNTIGVFVTSTADGFTNYLNISHTVGSEGKLTGASSMSYPEGENNVNIYAYAPYNENWSSLGSKTFSVKTDQSSDADYIASDLLYATVTNQASQSDAVELTFTHKLSLLNVTITNNSETSLADAKIFVTGTKTSANFDISNGNLGDANGAPNAITAVSTLGTATSACAVIIPQTVASGTALVKIAIGTKTLLAKLSSDQTFATGQKYNYTVDVTDFLGGEATEGEVALTAASITAWGSNDVANVSTEEAGTSALYATIAKPGSVTNGTWDATNNLYTWTATNNNLLSCFTFENGELAKYTYLHFTLSNLSTGSKSNGSLRINLLYNDNTNNDKQYYTVDGNAKNVSISTILKEGKTAADVTAIRFGGNGMGKDTGEGDTEVAHTSDNVTLTNMYLDNSEN